MRDVLRHNWIAFVFVIACVLSFVIADQDSADRDRAQAKQLVKGCVRTSTRSALSAAENFEIAQARKQRGDPASAIRHSESLANGFLWTIPVPPGFKIGDPAVAEVEYVEVAGQPTARLTASAHDLVIAGCTEAYR